MDKRRIEGFLLGCLLFVTAAVFFFLGAKYSLLFSGSSDRETSFVIQHGTMPTSSWPTTTTAPPPAFGSVDLNTVTAEELQRIPGIGETFAQRIVAYREEIGGFTSLEQLKEVQGIGETRYTEWSVYFTLN